MTILADIATGHTAGADVLFLLAAIAAVLAAVLYATTTKLAAAAPVLLSVAVGLVAVAWLVL